MPSVHTVALKIDSKTAAAFKLFETLEPGLLSLRTINNPRINNQLLKFECKTGYY